MNVLITEADLCVAMTACDLASLRQMIILPEPFNRNRADCHPLTRADGPSVPSVALREHFLASEPDGGLCCALQSSGDRDRPCLHVGEAPLGREGISVGWLLAWRPPDVDIASSPALSTVKVQRGAW